MKRQKNKLFVEIELILTSILIVMFIGMGFFLIKYQNRILNREKEKSTKLLTNIISDISAYHIYNYSSSELKENIKNIQRTNNEDIYSIEVYNLNGELLEKAISEEEIPKRFRIEKESFCTYETFDGESKKIGKVVINYSNFSLQQDLVEIQTILVATIVLFLIILSSVILLVIKKLVTKPIGEVLEQVKKMRDGNLSTSSYYSSNDEIGFFSYTFYELNNKLKNVFSEIKSGSNDIVENLNNVSEGNEEMSDRTNSQASAIEETSATIAEINGIVNNYTEKTKLANDITQQTKIKTEEIGNKSVKLYEAMLSITDSSKKIENIVNVIDDIAFQTNLLAINAAVEAARAGAQGKGFAVVASEIRKLAKKSSESAKEIKGLIKESAARIEEGNKFVDETLMSLNGVINEVNEVAGVIEEIADTAGDQAKGIEQVQHAIQEIEEVTQYQVERAVEVNDNTSLLLKKVLNFLDLTSYFQIEEESNLFNKKEESNKEKEFESEKSSNKIVEKK